MQVEGYSALAGATDVAMFLPYLGVLCPKGKLAGMDGHALRWSGEWSRNTSTPGHQTPTLPSALESKIIHRARSTIETRPRHGLQLARPVRRERGEKAVQDAVKRWHARVLWSFHHTFDLWKRYTIAGLKGPKLMKEAKSPRQGGCIRRDLGTPTCVPSSSSRQRPQRPWS